MAYQDDLDEDELSPDLRNDILLSFNLYKNDSGKIAKLKLRSMLFSFVMYKSPPSEINDYIEEQTSPEQELFTFEEVCKLVQYKIKAAKEKEAEELFNYLTSNKQELTKDKIKKAFDDNQIGLTEEEIKEMIQFMVEKEPDIESYENEETTKADEKLTVNKDSFKAFYTDIK